MVVIRTSTTIREYPIAVRVGTGGSAPEETIAVIPFFLGAMVIEEMMR